MNDTAGQNNMNHDTEHALRTSRVRITLPLDAEEAFLHHDDKKDENHDDDVTAGGEASHRSLSAAEKDNASSEFRDSLNINSVDKSLGVRTESSRVSSLKLRKLPPEILLVGDLPPDSESLDDDDELGFDKGLSGVRTPYLLTNLCLNPRFELRTQLLLSFGSLSFVSIFTVVITCILTSILVGENVKNINQETVAEINQRLQGRNARYLVESLHHRLLPRDAVEILYQATLDRFEGYPAAGDEQVPFADMDSGKNVYPVIGPYVPFEWNVSQVVTPENVKENLQTRQGWYNGLSVSTASAMFHIQGACDPSETNPRSMMYYPGCSEENNDLFTGGVVNPSNLTSMIYRKGADLVPILKALFEYYQDFRNLGVFPANGGAGASLNFPAYNFDGTTSYISDGCDWMREPNPHDPTRSIGTEEMIAKCRPEGEIVSTRLYNPMERSWCRNQALKPDRVSLEGPYEDAWVSGRWFITIGRAVYDRATKNFVACTFFGLDIDFLAQIMKASRIYPNAEVSIVRLEGGAVVASSAWNITEDGEPPPIYELNKGVTRSVYETFSSLVSFDETWDPDEVRSLYENTYIESNGFFLSCHPFPPIPMEYEEEFVPEALVIIAVPKSDVFEAVENANEDVGLRVEEIILFSVVTGCAAVLLSAAIVVFMSRSITAPLRYMNETARDIVNSFGSSSPTTNNFSQRDPGKSWLDFTPKTEIGDVVNAFKKVVSSFSGGSLMARSEDAKSVEVGVFFPMRTVFADLYTSRAEPNNPLFAIQPSHEGLENPINIGSNLVGATYSEDRTQPPPSTPTMRKGFTSSVFLWTILLIVIPLLLTMVAIAVVSTMSLVREFDTAIDESEEFLLDVEIKSLGISAGLRSEFASQQASRSVRDLYLMTRYAGWLFFGGLGVADGLPTFQNVIDQCKGFSGNPDECPAAAALRVCDCKWIDSTEDCSLNTRHLQKPYIIVQSDGALANGTRWKTLYPATSTTPETTDWWKTEEIPIRSNISSSPIYATSFDRARISAATSPVLAAIENYRVSRPHGVEAFMAFNDDGMYLGSPSCSAHRHPYRAGYESTDCNEAINPTLCPKGRFGYDPRCREWYDSAKRKFLDTGTALFVTAPYLFSDGSTIGQSAVSHLTDPQNGHFLGETLLDFSTDPILETLTDTTTPLQDGFPLLITPDSDNASGDVVIGPGFDQKKSTAVPVTSLVVPQDLDCAENESEDCLWRVKEFNAITDKMKNCMAGVDSFERLVDNGDTEKMYIAYAPVKTPFLDPTDSSDFRKGALLKNDRCIYSLALVETEKGLKQPFRGVEEKYHHQTRIAMACLAVIIFFAVAIAVVVSYLVTRSIAGPMLHLLEIIESVDSKSLDQELPELERCPFRGSKELMNVANTMETLFQVVRFANMAFYAGELEVAYRVLRDALRIFRGVENKKAVSVACNNLGNILLVMFLDMKQEETNSLKFGLTREEIIAQGTAYYHEAIRLGEAAYDEFHEKEGWTANCLDFMQHLSNRYFNRAMFLLTVKDDHEKPAEIERLGLRDLEISRDMDVEIDDQGEEVGWGRTNRSEKLFHAALTRVRGLLLLLELGYPDEWEVEDKLYGLLKMVIDESQKDSSVLFNEIGYVGRLQQVETELMKYTMIQNDIDTAARIAIRPLFEDEYHLAEAKVQAIRVMVSYLNLNGDKWDAAARTALKKWLEDSMDAVSSGLDSERHSLVSATALSVLSKSFVSPKGESRASSVRFSINDLQCVTMERF
eukprot:scaffold569_cov165-Amphora_coffeaeformis.AAC.25